MQIYPENISSKVEALVPSTDVTVWIHLSDILLGDKEKAGDQTVCTPAAASAFGSMPYFWVLRYSKNFSATLSKSA